MIRSARAALFAVGLLAVTGCTAAGATSGAAPATAVLRVGLVEWRIVSSGPAITAGADRIIVTNTGTTAHDLHVTGPGLHLHTPLLPPGSSTTLLLTSRAGTRLVLTCEVTGHEAAGMRTVLAVTGGAPDSAG